MPHVTTLRRLAAMSLAEIAGRGKQETAKVIEALAGPRRDDVRALLGRSAPAFADSGALVDMLRNEAPKRFFAGVENPAGIANDFPIHRDAVVAAADKSMAGRFDLLGFESLSFGDPIDWQRDPVSGRRAPSVHWSRVDALDASTVGDSKVIWELNR